MGSSMAGINSQKSQQSQWLHICMRYISLLREGTLVLYSANSKNVNIWCQSGDQFICGVPSRSEYLNNHIITVTTLNRVMIIRNIKRQLVL